jgi:hypothetical protein
MMQSPAPAARPAPAGLDPRRWWVLALLCGAFFMVLLDGTITAPRPAAESSARAARAGPDDQRHGLRKPAPPTAV